MKINRKQESGHQKISRKLTLNSRWRAFMDNHQNFHRKSLIFVFYFYDQKYAKKLFKRDQLIVLYFSLKRIAW